MTLDINLYTLPFLLFSGVLGLVFGSFLSMFTYRYPREEPITMQRSRCPSCQTPLGWRDLFPLFSWLLQKGRCRHCKAPISKRYPAIELATAAGFVLVGSQVGMTTPFIPLAILVCGVVALIATDLEYWIIPDPVHVFLIPAGLYYGYLNDTWIDQIAGMLFGLGLGLFLHFGYKWLRKRDGLGLGDVKFLATAGAWLGMYGLVPFSIISGVLGIVFALIWRMFSEEKIYFPFGPALAFTLLICVLFEQVPLSFWTMMMQWQQ